MCATRWAVGAAVLAAVCSLSAAWPPPPGELVVHEWGTFSSFSGSDGTLLKFNPSNTDLPRFVHRGATEKEAFSGTTSLETPVLYFYSARPVTASVQAEFPAGVFTEWYPRADHADRRNVLSWTDVRIRPGEPVRLPDAPGESRYYAAREVDAAPLEVRSAKDGDGRWEQEKFLFYRGVGDLRPPLTVMALGGGSFAIRNGGGESIAGLLLVEVKGGAIRYRRLAPLAAGASATAELTGAGSSASPVRDELVGMLVKAGLFAKEARAMVRTWESAWFGDEGTRLLSILPAGWTERALPLRVTPKPESLVRVMVGRHDILTPEREREIDGIVRQLRSPSREERQAAERALAKLGRFAVPARKRAEERLAGRR